MLSVCRVRLRCLFGSRDAKSLFGKPFPVIDSADIYRLPGLLIGLPAAPGALREDNPKRIYDKPDRTPPPDLPEGLNQSVILDRRVQDGLFAAPAVHEIDLAPFR